MIRKFILPFFLSVSMFVPDISSLSKERSPESKILFEYNSSNTVAVTHDKASAFSLTEESSLSIQILFIYTPFSKSLYDRSHLYGESFAECSRRYHTQKNKELLPSIPLSGSTVFVSEYTPYIFINYKEYVSFDYIYSQSLEIAELNFVDSIRIYPSHLYDLDSSALEDSNETSIPNASVESGNSDSRLSDYENFPKGTKYTGKGINIGILDTGIFDTSHSNFGGITVKTVYDTYTSNDESYHPTWVASVLGGRYGYASGASLYYVDVNSEANYVGIERLIKEGCHIINMSISRTSCLTNGEYDTSLEAYLDYIYVSTLVTMVASAGNTLNKEGSGGYVVLPALTANIISVGSVNNSGVPSDFSSYNRKNDVNSNPNLVAVGENRIIPGFNQKNGTSFSAPAVTGAIALFFEKNGAKALPALLSVLSATANDDIVDKSSRQIEMSALDSSGKYNANGNLITCTNNLKSNGSRERTGAGILDITELLNYSNSFIGSSMDFTSTTPVQLKGVYLTEGQKIRVSLAWERRATLTINKFLLWETSRTYSSDTLADFDLQLYNNAGSIVKTSASTMTNVEILEYTATYTGYYYIKAKPYSNYSDTHYINYAYVVK